MADHRGNSDSNTNTKSLTEGFSFQSDPMQLDRVGAAFAVIGIARGDLGD